MLEEIHKNKTRDMGKKSRSKNKKSGGGKRKPSGGGGGSAATPSAAAPTAASAAVGPSSYTHQPSIPLESNMGVQCWTVEELPQTGTGERIGWPDCHVCGAPNSSKLCSMCIEWGLPLEVSCSQECCTSDWNGHVARMHEPHAEWTTGKRIVFQRAAENGYPMDYGRLLAHIEETHPHPRDRNEARQRMAGDGRQMAQDWSRLEERLEELGLAEDDGGNSEGGDIMAKIYGSDSDTAEDGSDGMSEEEEYEDIEENNEACGEKNDGSEGAKKEAEGFSEDAIVEVLSYFTLQDLDEFRQVSKSFHNACNNRKQYIHGLLKKGKSVEIVGLMSERGKQLNHRLAVVNGRLTSGRYPMKILHLTGEVESIGIKAQNLNPFLAPEQESKEKSRLSFINYSSDAKLREGHGRFLDQLLMLLRYGVNVVNEFTYFNGVFNDFYSLPRGDRRVAQCNSQLWTLYRVKPSTAGFRSMSGTDDLSVLDSTIRTLIDNTSIYLEFAEMARYKKDGPGGRLIVRNFVRFMESWDKERIHGNFWIAKIVSSGTLVVQELEGGQLGNVYLVKGIGSQVGEDLPPEMLPFLARTCFVPLYDMLVYDGILIGKGRSGNQVLTAKIQAHVTKAVREQNVIYCGESSARGLWDTKPPELPTFSSEPAELEDSSKDAPYIATPVELDSAKLLVKYAKKIQSKHNRPTKLIVRRFGWTREENPNLRVGLLFTHNQHPHAMHQFCFQSWPCYTLEELIPEIVEICKQERAVPCVVWMDELSLIPQMKAVLKQAAEAVGFGEVIDVEWYPPPSAEEEAYIEENPAPPSIHSL